jgi:isoleucyl-tRNA synthetase
MLRWMAPFLSFTAEEAWKIVGKTDSIFMETYSKFGVVDEALITKWSRIRDIRDEVNKRIEILRAVGKVGSSLQAAVAVYASEQLNQSVQLVTNPMLDGTVIWNGNDYRALSSLGDDLKYVFITSSVELHACTDNESDIQISVASGQKCERCWHYCDDVGVDAAHPTICGRCTSNLNGIGESRTIA